jgi:hypothetical protein
VALSSKRSRRPAAGRHTSHPHHRRLPVRCAAGRLCTLMPHQAMPGARWRMRVRSSRAGEALASFWSLA